MCGIVGFHGRGTTQDLHRMADALAHRGPDGEGFFVDETRRMYLGHRRLAILDIAGGNQPMWNEDHSVCVVFNGEIYNHHDLRTELKALGHGFQTHHSDTEVLVHGFEQWGEDLPDKLNGMFAFAIYDSRRNVLFLARDRFGKKPLFYIDEPGLFIFASELSSVLQHPEAPRAADRQALMKYFAYGFFPAPYTLVKAVRKLPGGHFMSLDLASGRATIRPYWAFSVDPLQTVPKNAERAWPEELRHLLSQAVRRRLESDVPLGVLLSGGVDSSAILALAGNHVERERLSAYSIGFNEPTFDESAFAERAAKFVGCNHHHQICDLTEAKADLPGLLSRLDEPLGDSSILPTFFATRFARSGVTVALTGDGGDEMFAGYDPFLALAASDRYWRMVPRKLTPWLRRGADLLPISEKNISFDFKVKRWLRGMNHPPALWGPLWMGALDPDEIGELFGVSVSPEDLYAEALAVWQNCTSPDPVDRMLEYFTRFYMQDGVLLKSDRASMLVSLELRSPFLDRDVVDFARRLPSHFKLRNGERKFILRKALADVLPADILNRRKKGFGLPLAKWLREIPPPSDTASVPFVDGNWLRRKWDLHAARRGDYRHGLWCWLTLDAFFSGKLAGSTRLN